MPSFVGTVIVIGVVVVIKIGGQEKKLLCASSLCFSLENVSGIFLLNSEKIKNKVEMKN